MTDKEKKNLICLLRKYQADLLEIEEQNEKAKQKYQKWTRDFDEHFQYGIKAQYNHARVIADKLDAEIGKKIKGYFD